MVYWGKLKVLCGLEENNNKKLQSGPLLAHERSTSVILSYLPLRAGEGEKTMNFSSEKEDF